MKKVYKGCNNQLIITTDKVNSQPLGGVWSLNCSKDDSTTRNTQDREMTPKNPEHSLN